MKPVKFRYVGASKCFFLALVLCALIGCSDVEPPADTNRYPVRIVRPLVFVVKKFKGPITKDQAEKKIITLKKDLFNIRFKKINNQINNPAQYNQIKKSIARLYTTLKNSK